MSTQTKSDGFFVQVILPVIVIMVLLILLTWSNAVVARNARVSERAAVTQEFQKEAIEAGFAKYDAQDGHWRWKDESELILLNLIETGGPKLTDDEDGPEFPLSQPPKKKPLTNK